MTMEPTMQLRWVRRAMEPDVSRLRPVKVRVLQQLYVFRAKNMMDWWLDQPLEPAQWRDVPIFDREG